MSPRRRVEIVVGVAVFALVVGAWWLLRHDRVATPGAAAGYRVEMDLFSGRDNPVLPLEPGVAEELWLLVADQRAAGEGAPAEPTPGGLGFRGLVVTSPNPDDPPLRLLPDAVEVNGTDGVHRLADGGLAYTRVYDALHDHLDADVLAALPPTDPGWPDVHTPLPDAVGSPGSWVLADPAAVTAASTSLDLLVTRVECSGGVTGEVLPPVLAWADDQLLIRTDVAPLPPGQPRTCPGNDAVAVTVDLGRPLGERALLDVYCARPPGLRFAMCAEGAVRWRP